MPKLEREDFINAVRQMAGDSPDDDGLAFIQNMTDTYDGLVSDQHVDYKQMYEENDKNWRKKYADAFLAPIQPKKETAEEHAESVRISDLFIRKE